MTQELEMICFQLITSVGNARSLFIEAIREAKKGEYKKAQELMEEGSKSLKEGHSVHFELLQKEAEGQSEPIPLLLIHAEDQMMSAEAFKILGDEFINVYRRLDDSLADRP